MSIASLIPVVAVGVGIPGFVAFVALLAGHTRKMKELAIRDRELELAANEVALAPVIDALRDKLDHTRAQVAEVQERLDFAERLLTAGSPSGNRSPDSSR